MRISEMEYLVGKIHVYVENVSFYLLNDLLDHTDHNGS
jgi:hypothetical protein